MATFNKFQPFLLAMASKVHDLSSDQLKVALVNAANLPDGTEEKLGDLTEIAYTYASSRNLTTDSVTQALGTLKVIVDDLTITASGGSIGPFQGVVIYNDTATNDELIGWYDLGSEVTILDTKSILLDFNNVDGIFVIA